MGGGCILGDCWSGGNGGGGEGGCSNCEIIIILVTVVTTALVVPMAVEDGTVVKVMAMCIMLVGLVGTQGVGYKGRWDVMTTSLHLYSGGGGGC